MITLLLAGIAMSQNQIQGVSALPTEGVNRHYPGNRAPLAPLPMIKLPVGAVRAKGWLEEYLKRQRDGMTGHLPELSPWLKKEGSAWFSPDGKGAYGWEEVPYWLKGYANLGYLLDDQKIIAEAKVWLEGAITNQRPSGDFGPDHRLANGTKDHWGNMIMLQCLQSFHEHSGDKRVLDLMTRYFRYQNALPDSELFTDYWEHNRGGDNLASIYWLYNRTGEPFLLEFAKKNHARTLDWTREDDLPDWHNVNIAQSFDEPAIFWQQSRDDRHLKAAYRNFDLARAKYGQVPGGMFGADENARPGRDDPRQATETCGFVEQMQSDQELMRITGDIKWADHCEQVAFNSYPAAVMPDFRSLRYLTAPNMVVSDRHNHAPGYANRGPFVMMNPLSNRCCQHNHSHGWPYFTENLWQATADNGLVAAMYSASEVTAKVGDGATVTITEETNYPFEDSIRFAIKVDRPAEFPIYFRIPGWSSDAILNLNGEKIQYQFGGAKGYFRINRIWKTGDRVELKLPMEVRTHTWTRNHDSRSVNYGPLTFSLKIGEDVVRADSRTTTQWDSKWNPDVDPEKWPAFEILPTTPWNYGLVPRPEFEVIRKPWPKSNFPFTHAENPIEIRVKGRQIPEWSVDRTDLLAELQDSPAKSAEPIETLTLIPMGAARLRISAFPTASPTGKLWTRPVLPLPYSPVASHVYGGDDIWALCDQIASDSSADETIPRHTFWDHKGTDEWVEYNFAEPKTIKGVEVLWYDDTGKGQCRVPASWRVQVKSGGTWIDVKNSGPGPVARDRFNVVRFEAVATNHIRLLIQLQPEFSGGILEWKIIE